MKTFVILTRRADGAAEDFKRLAKPEVLHVWQGFADGIVRAVHGLAAGPGAAFELESTPSRKRVITSRRCLTFKRICYTCSIASSSLSLTTRNSFPPD